MRDVIEREIEIKWCVE